MNIGYIRLHYALTFLRNLFRSFETHLQQVQLRNDTKELTSHKNKLTRLRIKIRMEDAYNVPANIKTSKIGTSVFENQQRNKSREYRFVMYGMYTNKFFMYHCIT